MSKHYELIIFTASLSKYADPLVDRLDSKRVCFFRLFREHCSMINGAFVKDMGRLDRDLKDVIILDVSN
jgi:RNA polymerase II subunit A small phosphatase-like protein